MVWIKRRHLKLHCREDIRKRNVSFQGLTESPAFVWLFPSTSLVWPPHYTHLLFKLPHWSLFWGGTFLPSRDSSSELIGLDLWAPVWKSTLSLSLDNNKSGGATRKRIRVKQLKGLIWQICATLINGLKPKQRWGGLVQVGLQEPVLQYLTKYTDTKHDSIKDKVVLCQIIGTSFSNMAEHSSKMRLLRTSKQMCMPPSLKVSWWCFVSLLASEYWIYPNSETPLNQKACQGVKQIFDIMRPWLQPSKVFMWLN